MKKLRYIVTLTFFLLISYPIVSWSDETSGIVHKEFVDKGIVAEEAQPPEADLHQRPTSCQQVCYKQYKAGTDICYGLNTDSTGLNLCIMTHREVFKICSKNCQ